MTPTDTPSQEVGFTDKYKVAIALCDSLPTLVITTAEAYRIADAQRKQARDLKESLIADYNAHPVVQAAKQLQAQKIDLEKRLDAFNRDVKAGPMLVYEKAEEAKRLAEQARLAAEAKKLADAEAAAAAKVREAEAKKAEAEAARIRAAAEKEAARVAAEQEKIRQANEAEMKRLKADGDKQALAEAKARAAQAELDVKAAAEAAMIQAATDAAEAAKRAEDARAEAERIRQESAKSVTPVVILEKTAPSVARTRVYRWRLTARDGRQYIKDDFKKVLRLRPADLLDGVPPTTRAAIRCALRDSSTAWGRPRRSRVSKSGRNTYERASFHLLAYRRARRMCLRLEAKS